MYFQVLASERDFYIMKTYKNHPLSEIFPLIEDHNLEKMVEDIERNGLQNPIVLYEGKILDGRNRYKACQIAGLDPIFSEHQGDPLSFVLSANLHRRHLTESQRAMIAGKISNLVNGQKTSSANLQSTAISQSEAAAKMKVSTRSVASAKKILNEAPDKLVKEVESGKKSVSAALAELKDKSTEPVLDGTGYTIPDELIELWNRGKEVKEMLSYVGKISGALRRAQEAEDILYRSLNFSSALTHLENSKISLKTALPFAVCWTCSGRNVKKCNGVCKGTGLVSEFSWNSFAPMEIKQIRTKMSARGKK